MNVSHIIVEGYCSLTVKPGDDEQKIFPCMEYGAGRLGHYCFSADENDARCKHLSWCEADSCIIMTDEHGLDFACTSYLSEHSENLKAVLRAEYRAAQRKERRDMRKWIKKPKNKYNNPEREALEDEMDRQYEELMAPIRELGKCQSSDDDIHF